MSKEYVFWLKQMTKSAFFFNFLDAPKKIIKVVITENQIRFVYPIGVDSQDILSINLLNVAQVKWSVSARASIGYVEISTQELEHYYLTPVNPFDPTLGLVQDNTDELIAFCNIVVTLKNHQTPDFDENPYLRQFQKNAKPSYLKDKDNIILWDKNVSPVVYYYKFVPESKEKKRRLVYMIHKSVTFGAIIASILGILYMLYGLLK
jgi:hypothetical protein